MPDIIKIVVAGDVDSGKSTLIGRYLYESGSLKQGAVDDIKQVCQNLGRSFEFAYLLDSFQEEREKELTIDTTQCFCKSGKNNTIIFIDVPGHQELLKNMLSGASCADMAILMIDINKSVKDQTKRHTFILKFLGISRIITVINKMDSSRFSELEFLKTREEIFRVFKKLGLVPGACLPICANRGDNLFKRSKEMTWYKGKLLKELLDNTQIQKNTGSFRFLVQDIYKSKGKNIAAGIITSGAIKAGDTISVLPAGKISRVKTIKYFDKNVRLARSPQAVGITLKNTPTPKRGQILSSGRLPLTETTFSGSLICTQDINLNTSFNFHCTIQKEKAKIDRIIHRWDAVNLLPKKTSGLKQNDLAQVILRTNHKVVIEKYRGNNNLGRFVLTDNQGKIAAVGTIL